MLTDQQILNALRCNRTEFGNLFYTAQMQSNIPPIERIEFEVESTEADAPAAFQTALTFARNKKFLETFLSLVSSSRMEDGTIATFLVKSDTKLQAMINADAGFINPMVFGPGVVRSTQQTGKVLLDGQARGTGVLIGPHLFLTAWHVMRDMFEKTENAENKIVYQKKEKPAVITVEFNNFMDYVGGVLQPVKSVLVPAHKDWLVHYAACDESELAETGRLPEFQEELCDYAILRLERPIGHERCWVTEDEIGAPVQNQNIVLLQHPAGIPLKMDQSLVVGWVTEQTKRRFVHKLNANHGSSGGPCFNKDFKLVGLHQGSWTVSGGERANRGIPIKDIYRHYRNKYTTWPLPDPSDCKVWSLDEKTYQPVIGCDQFQSLLWESAINDSKRVIPILGNNRSGKSYLLNVAKAILPDKTHLKIELASAVIGKMSALAIAELICQKAGVAFPSITSLEKYNTTTAAWLKGEVVEKLINELEKHRTNRLVWLMISDMNHFTLEGENASDFLFLLCERTQQTSWLRVLLDGVPKIPLSLNAVAKAYRTQEIAADDLEAFLERFFAFIKDPPGGTRIRSYASFLFQTYQNDLNKGVSDPLSALSERSQQFISSFLN